MPPAAVVGAPFDPTNPLRPSEDTHRIFQWAHLNGGNAGDQKALLDDGWSFTSHDVHNKFYRKAWSSTRGTVTNPLLPETDRAGKFEWIALGANDMPTAHRATGYSYTSSKLLASRERHGDVPLQVVHVYRKRRADAPALAEFAADESDDGSDVQHVEVRLPVRRPLPLEDDDVVPAPDAPAPDPPAPAGPAPAPPARRVRARVENLREAHRRQDRAARA